MKNAFLFPGQGAQSVGMGKDIAEAYPAARAVFDKANSIVGFDLSRICFEGPAAELNRTSICQPAIFAVSAAILEVLRSEVEGFEADVTAGLSLGEYTALYAAGVLSFEDALVLVQRRGEAMQAASEERAGGMVSILGLEQAPVEALCSEAGEDEVLSAANFNCPGQIVISGGIGACMRAEELAGKYGAMKAVRLEVAGAFHTEMMSSAAEKLSEALSKCRISEPGEIKTIANVDAEYYGSAEEIADGLKRQLTCPILWQKCMERLLSDGIERFYEIGTGRVLTALMRRINRKTKVVNVNGPDAVRELVSV